MLGNNKNQDHPVKPVTYSVIKSALIGLTKYLSTYWLNGKVRVNALSPGGVLKNQPIEFVEKIEKLIPMGEWQILMNIKQLFNFYVQTILNI